MEKIVSIIYSQVIIRDYNVKVIIDYINISNDQIMKQLNTNQDVN